jgi:hypothetical protein
MTTKRRLIFSFAALSSFFVPGAMAPVSPRSWLKTNMRLPLERRRRSMCPPQPRDAGVT